jgi:hypothetical protein
VSLVLAVGIAIFSHWMEQRFPHAAPQPAA